MKLSNLFLLGGLALMTTLGCSKEDDVSPATGPKEYTVEYKISSTTGSSADFVLYYNETGGQTQLTSVKLPVTYTFKRTMKQGDVTSISASLANATATSEVTTAILLDGKQVETKTARGQSALATSVYVIGQ
jgi:hypothetical protein